MERIIQIQESGKRFDGWLAHRIDIRLALANRIEFAFIAQAFGREASCSSLEQASNFNSVPNVFKRELPHNKATRRVWFKQAFVRQPLQCEPDRRAGYTKTRTQRMF